MNLFPIPQSCQLREGTCPLPDSLELPEIPVQIEEALSSQEYYIHIEEAGIRIRAGSEQAAVYAGATINQIHSQSGRSIPCMDIHDWPDIEVRGLMLDISRCKVPTMDCLFDLVDWMASIKLNQLQLYIEHTFAFPGHEIVWEKASPMTDEEIRALDLYCADRYIELVPNFNSFGHMERFLQHEPYRHLAECPDGFYSPNHRKQFTHGTTLYPSDEAASFLAPLFDSYLPAFRSSLFNVGGDEPWELGVGRSAGLVAEVGKGRVYLEFMKRIHQLVVERNHRMLCWADIIMDHPEIIPEIPKDIIPVIWGYSAHHPFDEHCAKVKACLDQYYVAPGNNTWSSLTCRLDEAIANMNNAASNALRHGASGYLITTWGDNGNHQPYITTLPGILQGACVAWSVEKREEVDLSAYFSGHYFDNPALGECLVRMGRIERPLPHTRPDLASVSSPTHTYLFADAERLREDFECAGSLPSSTVLREFIESCDQLDNDISAREPSPSDAVSVSEMRLGLSMARLGARRAGILFHDWEDPSWPADLRDIMQEYHRVWLLRSRIGGLEESMEYLSKLLS